MTYVSCIQIYILSTCWNKSRRELCARRRASVFFSLIPNPHNPSLSLFCFSMSENGTAAESRKAEKYVCDAVKLQKSWKKEKCWLIIRGGGKERAASVARLRTRRGIPFGEILCTTLRRIFHLVYRTCAPVISRRRPTNCNCPSSLEHFEPFCRNYRG